MNFHVLKMFGAKISLELLSNEKSMWLLHIYVDLSNNSLKYHILFPTLLRTTPKKSKSYGLGNIQLLILKKDFNM